MQRVRTAALIVALGIFVTACSPAGQPAPSASPEVIVEQPTDAVLQQPTDTATDSGTAVMTKTFTLAVVAQHATKDDCWMAMEGGVYDITPVIASGKHPGGAAIIAGCGKDGTAMFNNRPNDSGAHSEKARAGLMGTKIGVLAQ